MKLWLFRGQTKEGGDSSPHNPECSTSSEILPRSPQNGAKFSADSALIAH